MHLCGPDRQGMDVRWTYVTASEQGSQDDIDGYCIAQEEDALLFEIRQCSC